MKLTSALSSSLMLFLLLCTFITCNAFINVSNTKNRISLYRPSVTITTGSSIISSNDDDCGKKLIKGLMMTTGENVYDGDDDDDHDDDEEEEHYDPLQDGVDSVSWLPSLNDMSTRSIIESSTPSPSTTAETTTTSSSTEVLPFFPLGGIVYTPNSEHVLNIFEPRYRQMYTDILMNGSKRFVVSMSHPNKDATFATTGVIFYLEDLKEVSELTDDQVKYICNHRVTNRVILKKVLNPQAWNTRETYLKVECEIIHEDDDDEDENGQSYLGNAIDSLDEDDDDDEDNNNNDTDTNEKKDDVYQALLDAITPKQSKAKRTKTNTSNKKKHKYSPEEMMLIASFQNLVEKQHEAQEDVRFTRSSVDSIAVAPGSGEDGLWQTIRLWQSFIDQRLVARQNEMQMEFQEKLMDFLKKERGISENEMPSAIGFSDLSPSLQKEVQDLQKRMSVELKPLVLESTLTIQKILEADDHKARCLLLKHFMDVEKKRLDAKSTLQGMFAGNVSAVTQEESNIQSLTSSSPTQEGNGSTASTSQSSSSSSSSSNISDEDKLPNISSSDSSSQQGALYIDEPDAFQ